jgi:hypothetical protein
VRSVLLIFLAGAFLIGIAFLGSLFGFWLWTEDFLIIIGSLIFITVVSDQINLQALDQQGRSVIIPYLVSTILKLLFSAIFLILYIKQNIESAKLVVFTYLVSYAVFSALEIIIVNKRTRAKKF